MKLANGKPNDRGYWLTIFTSKTTSELIDWREQLEAKASDLDRTSIRYDVIRQQIESIDAELAIRDDVD